MSGRDAIAAVIGRDWPAGECHYCGITDERVDGDRVCWFDSGRNVCNRPGCIQQFRAAVERWAASAARSSRRRNSAEIHQLIKDQARKKRKEYREAAKARRKGRVA